MSRNDVSACAVPPSPAVLAGGTSLERQEQRLGSKAIPFNTIHGKSSSNPGGKFEPWTPSAVQDVNNDPRVTAHPPVSVQLLLLHSSERILSSTVVRPLWYSMDKQKWERSRKRTRELKPWKPPGLKLFLFHPPGHFVLCHACFLHHPKGSLTRKSYHFHCLCSRPCCFYHTPCHPHPPPSTPVLAILSKLHFPAQQPFHATACHRFSSGKQPPLKVLPILVSSPLLNFSPILHLPVLNYTLFCKQGLILFAL